MRKLLFIFGLGSLVLGSYYYYRKQLKLLADISFKVVGVKIVEYSPFKLQINTEITNNSEISFTISGYDIDVIVNGKEIGQVKNSSLNQKLEGFGGKSQINFFTTFNPQETGLLSGGLSSILSNVLDTLGDTTIKLKGRVSVKRGLFVYSNYPIDFTYKLEDFL